MGDVFERKAGIGAALGGVTKHIGQVWSEISNRNAKCLSERPHLREPDLPLPSLDEAEVSAGDTCCFADIRPRQPVRVDVFGNIHAIFLLYVNFTCNRDFT